MNKDSRSGAKINFFANENYCTCVHRINHNAKNNYYTQDNSASLFLRRGWSSHLVHLKQLYGGIIPDRGS